MSEPHSVSRTASALGCAAFCCAALMLMPQAAVAGPVGQLYCNVSGGVGFIITSRRALNCEFSPSSGARHQHYVGTISRFGLDIGSQGPSKLTWDVVSLGGPVGPRLPGGRVHGRDGIRDARGRGRGQCVGGWERRDLAAADFGPDDRRRRQPRSRGRCHVARLRALTREPQTGRHAVACHHDPSSLRRAVRRRSLKVVEVVVASRKATR